MKFACFGGDMRIVSLASMLEAAGHSVCCFALENAPADKIKSCSLCPAAAAAQADCVILPLPAENSHGGLNAPFSAFPRSMEKLLSGLTPKTIICAGKPSSELLALAERQQLRMVDYFQREELVALNALATAEGAISVLLQNSPITIWDSKILIIGYGRIGKMLAERLRAMGAHVSVSARKPGDMAYVRAMGCKSLNSTELSGRLGGFDTVINTVPSLILNKELLTQLPPEVLLMDLASRPGGIDFEAAADMGLNVIWALGLPAETAPVTAGRIIMETVLNILAENGIGD